MKVHGNVGDKHGGNDHDPSNSHSVRYEQRWHMVCRGNPRKRYAILLRLYRTNRIWIENNAFNSCEAIQLKSIW